MKFLRKIFPYVARTTIIRRKVASGFTLVELLVSFAIIAVVASVSIYSFSAYTKSQIFGQSILEFADLLGVSRSRAISQIKPASCGNLPLEGYEVRITPLGSDYTQYARCGGNNFLIFGKKLPGQVTFSSTSSTSMLFNVSNGTVNTPGAFVLSGFGKSKTISVSQTGKVTMTDGTAPASPGQSPTTAPTSAPIAGGCTAQTASYRYYAGYGCVYVPPGYGTYCDATCGGQVSLATAAPTPTAPPTQSTPTTAFPSPTPTPTPASACSKDYYSHPPYCTYVGGGRGTHCDSSCTRTN